ncbi:MAG: glycine cleavage system aminomethyltransferase GcvT [Planctomycetes bacterium]|nr:glycine cleavage system aminomethyltransferase GcvT [Planctomycetota bacterium]
MAELTPLYERHVEMGARIIEFGGFMMPVQYSGIIEEHNAVRKAAGVFDVSHMGELEVSGKDALAFLNRLVTRNLEGLAKGRVAYGLMCREDGGILDDLTVYRRQDSYYLVVNASTAKADLAWMTAHRDQWGSDAEIRDLSKATGKIDLQGPLAAGIAAETCPLDTGKLTYFRFAEDRDSGMLVSRSGYTGEDGFEFYLPAAETAALWDRILQAGEGKGLLPCGLGARDTLRLEACLVLNGSDIGPEYDPIVAGLGWAVDLGKDDLVGVEALRSSAERVRVDGGTRVLAAFVLEGRSSGRHGDTIYDGENAVGLVTSGSFSPTLGRAVGMGYVAKNSAAAGTEVDVEIRKRRVRGKISQRPLYNRS